MKGQRHSRAGALPLCVDLDGTLIRTDLLHEALITYLCSRLTAFVSIIAWLLRGRSALKQGLARHVMPEVAFLPYRADLVAFISAERARGRQVHLVTASPQAWADAIAQHIGLFDSVVGTTNENLKGAAKARLLIERFGPTGFDYVGDHAADRAVWCEAAMAHGAGAKAWGWINAQPQFRRGAVFNADASSQWRALFRAMRPHQWSKNVLLFVSIAAAHRLLDLPAVLATSLAFVAFSLTASATYLVNDLLDLDTDRRHPRKRLRPFAAGDVSVATGLVAIIGLSSVAGALCLFLPPLFTLMLTVYVITTLAYSFRLKRAALADVLTLAGLYTLRILAGTAAAGITISSWLLAFSMFTFISLAIAKRCAELTGTKVEEGARIAGRGYYPGDLEVLGGMASASSFCASLVLAIYTNQPYVTGRYASPELLWLLCPFLIFILNRILILARRGQMDDDPIVFCARDRLTLKLAVLCAGIVIAATFFTIEPRIIVDG